MMREYRLFFIKLPNGCLYREIVSINKPVTDLKERLCDVLGVGEFDSTLLKSFHKTTIPVLLSNLKKVVY